MFTKILISRFNQSLFRTVPLFSLMKFSTDYTKTYSSKVELPKLEKSKLSRFFKAVHPDLFGSAPKEYREHNSRAMQDLNEYITSLEQNKGVNYTKLEFYIRSKEGAEEFVKSKVELLPIKAQVSSGLLKMHIKGVVDTLNAAITKNIEEESNTKMEADFQFTAKPMKQREIFVN